jgi:hypothetical protein
LGETRPGVPDLIESISRRANASSLKAGWSVAGVYGNFEFIDKELTIRKNEFMDERPNRVPSLHGMAVRELEPR